MGFAQRPALVVVLTLLAGCAKKHTATTGTDAREGVVAGASLDGAYLMIGFEEGGKLFTPEMVAKLPDSMRRFQIRDGKFISHDGDREEVMSIAFDGSKTPAEFTTTETGPDGKLVTAHGIYKVRGDTLTLCVAPKGNSGVRPREFRTDDGKGRIMLTLMKTN